jgi:hypothetical protein
MPTSYLVSYLLFAPPQSRWRTIDLEVPRTCRYSRVVPGRVAYQTNFAVDPTFALRACCDGKALTCDGFVTPLRYTPLGNRISILIKDGVCQSYVLVTAEYLLPGYPCNEWHAKSILHTTHATYLGETGNGLGSSDILVMDHPGGSGSNRGATLGNECTNTWKFRRKTCNVNG